MDLGVGNLASFKAACLFVLTSSLRSLSTDPKLEILNRNLSLRYNPYCGFAKLRESIAALYSPGDKKLTGDHVVVTPGSIMANFLVLDTICGPGDHIICQYPTYGQLYLVPQYSGVDVSLWRMDDENDWMLHIEELSGMIRPNTKAINLNNPSNPTGAVLKEVLLKVIEISRQLNILVFYDEVFPHLFFTDRESPTLTSLGHTNTGITGSLSDAFALPGVRRDFTTICVSRIDDGMASFALDQAVLPRLMEKNRGLGRERLMLLEDSVKRNGSRGRPVDDVEFSWNLAEEGVLVVPGGYNFDEAAGNDFKGYVRIMLGRPEVLRQGVPLLERFIQSTP
ncbi:pyridoxal phosphate-dependent transferase [Dactylonectria estremocensis]|uniref:Pyridoxal phosphate-dependent transferase n=1 Tax=Dactylonectria estremocensis TaxID=1079267 RepID=A0A9P9E6H2_9HYPO|nr:pyridoxal phosphate-dependent transferase [Dactylonectria estremocensis]